MAEYLLTGIVAWLCAWVVRGIYDRRAVRRTLSDSITGGYANPAADSTAARLEKGLASAIDTNAKTAEKIKDLENLLTNLRRGTNSNSSGSEDK